MSFLEFLVAARMSRRKYFRSHQIRLDALDVTPAAGSKGQAESVRLGVHFNQSFNRPQ
jgi:hypothetical protein